MAQESLVRQRLPKETINAGEQITSSLEKAGVRVTASLWRYLAESDAWRLVIASPEVRKLGPKKMYKKIQSILQKIPSESRGVALSDISVVEDDDPAISLLRSEIKTNTTMSGVSVAGQGRLIEDAIVYRST